MVLAEVVEALFDDGFGGAGAGGDDDGFDSVEPAGVNVLGAVDEVSADAVLAGNFFQALAVGAVLAADDEYKVRLRGQGVHSFLAVLRGVANVFLGRADDIGKALLKAIDDAVGV